MSSELRPCPACESSELVIDGFVSRGVRCLSCGATGPIFDVPNATSTRSVRSTDRRIRESWNALPRREDSAALREQVRELDRLRSPDWPSDSELASIREETSLCALDAIYSAETLNPGQAPRLFRTVVRQVVRAALAKLEGGEA